MGTKLLGGKGGRPGSHHPGLASGRKHGNFQNLFGRFMVSTDFYKTKPNKYWERCLTYNSPVAPAKGEGVVLTTNRPTASTECFIHNHIMEHGFSLV